MRYLAVLMLVLASCAYQQMQKELNACREDWLSCQDNAAQYRQAVEWCRQYSDCR